MATEIMPCYFNMTMCNGLAIYTGADWYAEFRIFNREKLVDTPIDLTGYTGRCSIKKHAGDDEAIATPTVTIEDGPNGIYSLSLTAEQTGKFITHGRDCKDVTDLVYDVYLDREGSSFRALMGSIQVSPRVTEEDDVEEE